MSKREIKAMAIVFFPTLLGTAATGGSAAALYGFSVLFMIPAVIYLHWGEFGRNS